MDVLCSDKTGTLTQNKLTLGDPFSVEGVQPDKVILAAALASRAENQDPIDLAVLAVLKDSTGSGNTRCCIFNLSILCTNALKPR